MLPNPLEELRAETTRSLAAQRKRLARRHDAIRKDLARVEEAQEMSRVAALGIAAATTMRRGTKTLAVVDYTTGEPVTREIALDPSKSPRESLERIFANARRLRKGAPVATARLKETERLIGALDRVLAAVATAKDEAAVRLARAAANLPAPKAAAAKPAQERKPPFRTFRTSNGTILVGRGAAKNDELTFHGSKPYHLWLHARGVPGAHVIVQLRRDQSCPSELLVDAAHLAAHFSDARGERTVEITHVPRKFVRKPKGSAPGAVVVEREKVLLLRFDDAHLARLLACEVDQNA